MNDVYSEAVESAFRTIAGAKPEFRERVFQLHAPDAVRYAKRAGIEKLDVVDRLDALAVDFWPDADVRQQRLAEAAKVYDLDDIAADVRRDQSANEDASTTELTTDNEVDIDDRPPAFSDEALALRFAERHADDLRYVALWGRWLIDDGQRWKSDDTLAAFNLVRHTVRTAARECNKPKVSVTLASAKTVSSVERLAKADRRLAATSDQWDVDPWLLNAPDGVLDLRTGRMQPHRPSDYMTKIAGVTPDHKCATPTWLRFLDRTMGGDAELIAFLKRMSGYALTGITSEHALFFCYGTGANGKSTLINALTGCAGDYHKSSPIETFTASSTERHPTDLAGLRGARMVTATETEEGRRWAESKIKSLTGGDKIAARFMRQDFFEFTPTFKLIVAGNHKPGLRSVDEAIRRRFHLIPFTVTIPPAERDESLADKLKAEWPGIMAWAVDGCLEWQRHGLAPPPAVRTATAAYLEAEDAMAAWIDDNATYDNTAWETSSALYRDWKLWAERAGEHPGSLRKFSQRLEDRGDAIGIRKARDAQGLRGFYGLRINRADLGTTPPEAAE